MASELLSSHNEAYWGERKVYMRETPITNPNPIHDFVPNPNPIHNFVPNPNPNPTPQRKNHGPDRHHNRTQPNDPPAVSADSSSSKRKPFDLGRRRETGGFVTYNISTYARKELRDLKRRLVSELELVRTLTSRIESRDPQSVGKVLPPEMASKCGQILNKMMKHKGAEWFNSPVDVVRLNLYDYCQIIKQPMDLGTVKTKLAKNLYPSPVEFADDVRLTFKNALIYNPEGHIVHKFAGQLLRLFESQFLPAHQKYQKQQEEAERQRALLSRPLLLPAVPEPPTRVLPPPSPPSLPLVVAKQQAKPKAKDPNKRAMSMEEKEKLGSALANLPQEKAAQVLQIVQKRNVHTAQEGDEVEIDFELMDNETLWELDRLVCNWKKTVSKTKRQEASATTCTHHPSSADAIHKVADDSTKKSKKLEACDEEDVDIGEELPVMNYPSVEIEKAGDEESLSSSGSSSSSDSDSGSSSGSDDSDGAESPAPGLRPVPT